MNSIGKKDQGCKSIQTINLLSISLNQYKTNIKYTIRYIHSSYELWHMSQKSFPKFFAVFEKTLYLYCLTFFPSSFFFFFFFSLSSFIWYAYLNHITSRQRDKWWSLAKSIFPEFPNFIYKSNQNKLYCYGYNKL